MLSLHIFTLADFLFDLVQSNICMGIQKLHVLENVSLITDIKEYANNKELRKPKEAERIKTCIYILETN
jgi:gamma-glutamyl-gamma-aminobutyrate hydrolase PuuD